MSGRVLRALATVAAAIVVATGLAACSSSGGGGDTYSLTATFPRTISLFPSSDVRVLGLPAGSVKSVTVVGTEVRVRLTITKSVPVPADVRATIMPLSLIGERYVQLFPVWTEGQPRAKDGDVIPRERTDIPVEPDEALAALKKFLDTLDPQATGGLIKNLAKDLEGNGQRLNDALKGTSDLVATLADKDDQLVRLIDNFDDFTQTLRTRESQLGRTMELFATTTDLLAQERRTIESLVANLASVSTNAFDLVSEHRARLDRDLTILTRVLQSVRTNIDQVEKVLDAGPLLVNGIKGAYSKQYHRLDLRTQVSPAVAQALLALGVPGANIPCVPVDVACPAGTPAAARAAVPAGAEASPADVAAASASGVLGADVAAPAASAPVATQTPPPSPIDSLVTLLGAPGAARDSGAPEGSLTAARVGRAAGGVGGFLRRTARLFLGFGQ